MAHDDTQKELRGMYTRRKRDAWVGDVGDHGQLGGYYTAPAETAKLDGLPEVFFFVFLVVWCFVCRLVVFFLSLGFYAPSSVSEHCKYFYSNMSCSMSINILFVSISPTF